ncbi:hypothetical protein HY256_00415 [Candidatus Sumerlaeota bacterium]|nr:hypothetical protein [Candidatus Sumerlaeota bacterium]
MPLDPQTEKNVNGILRYLNQYLELRFSHASRLNPKFRAVGADLKWHEMKAVGRVLRKSKPFGEHRFCVADVLVSFDSERKRGLYNPKNQTQILNEIVTVVDEKNQVQSGLLKIRDLRALYQTIDPFLLSIIELIQTWIWWDLQDAADMFHFDLQCERIYNLLRSQWTEAMANYYAHEMNRKPELGLEKQDVLDFEYYRTEDLVHSLARRREDQPDYQEIIARAGGDDTQSDAQILQLAQHVRVAQTLREGKEMDASLRDYFGRALHCAPAEVTVPRALEYQQRFLTQAKQSLAELLHGADAGGTPYDFKSSQIEEIERKLDAMKAEVNPRPAVKAEPVAVQE